MDGAMPRLALREQVNRIWDTPGTTLRNACTTLRTPSDFDRQLVWVLDPRTMRATLRSLTPADHRVAKPGEGGLGQRRRVESRVIEKRKSPIDTAFGRVRRTGRRD